MYTSTISCTNTIKLCAKTTFKNAATLYDQIYKNKLSVKKH